MEFGQLDKVAKKLNAQKDNHLQSFAFIYDKGNPKYHHNDVCYGALQNYYDDDEEEVKDPKARTITGFVSVFSPLFRKVKGYPLLSTEALTRYLKWVIDDSPWTKAFIKLPVDYLTWGVACDVTQSSNYLLSALSAVRYVDEDNDIVKIWDELVQQYGVNPFDAFIAAQWLFIVPNTNDWYFYNGAFRSTGHGCFDSNISKDTIKNFYYDDRINTTPAFNIDTSYNKEGSYITNLYSTGGGYKLLEGSGIAQKDIKINQWGSHKAYSCSTKEEKTVLAEFITKRMKEILA